MPTLRLGRSATWSVVALLCFVLLLPAAPVGADFNWGDYLSSGDPINVIFDINGTYPSAANVISTYLNWSVTGCGTNQNFPDHSSTPWEGTQTQRCSAVAGLSKDHVRFNQGNDWGGVAWGTWTMAPAHHENVLRCDDGWWRDVVDSFDGPRNMIVVTLGNQGYTTGWVYKGNIAASRQCDGSYVGGDGYYVWIDI
jgi:hypothetical protein